VPDYCRATLDWRTLPGETESDLLGQVEEAIARALGDGPASGRASIAVDSFATYTGAAIEAPNFAPAWFFEEHEPVVQRAVEGLRRAGLEPRIHHYAFCTNGSATAGRLGIPTIGFGPGDEELAHRVDEYIELDDLVAGARGYAGIVAALLA
jgi:acetylornithine deacetylase/succinyl-diaminopimelate desuccinylase-like protein